MAPLVVFKVLPPLITIFSDGSTPEIQEMAMDHKVYMYVVGVLMVPLLVAIQQMKKRAGTIVVKVPSSTRARLVGNTYLCRRF